jgi:hypothetical protein
VCPVFTPPSRGGGHLYKAGSREAVSAVERMTITGGYPYVNDPSGVGVRLFPLRFPPASPRGRRGRCSALGTVLTSHAHSRDIQATG